MTNRQTNTWSMMRDTAAFLTAAPETKRVPALAAQADQLVVMMNELSSHIADQFHPIEGTFAARDSIIDQAVDAAVTLAAAGLSYAEEHKLLELRAALRVTASDFVQTRLILRPVLLQQIHDALAPIAAELADYGIAPADIADLQARINPIKEAIGKSLAARISKTVATTQIAASLRAINALLTRQIDRLMLSLRKTQPEFYAHYKMARTVVRRPATRRAVEAAPEIAAPTPAPMPVAMPIAIAAEAPSSEPSVSAPPAVSTAAVAPVEIEEEPASRPIARRPLVRVRAVATRFRPASVRVGVKSLRRDAAATMAQRPRGTSGSNSEPQNSGG